VPRPPRANVVTGKWIFKHKLQSDGSLERSKARWVLRGFTQRPGVDFDETFSPVAKYSTVRTVLSLALSRSGPIHQLNVKNAFLHGNLTETVYCQQPSRFEDPAHPDFVCLLKKSLYGLKPAHAWYSRMATFLLSIRFVEAKSDTSLFVYQRGSDTTYLLLYVDDIVLTASSPDRLRLIISALQREFAMKDLGELHHFLKKTRPGRLDCRHSFQLRRKCLLTRRENPRTPAPSVHGGLSVAQVRIGPVTPQCFGMRTGEGVFLTQPEIRSHWESNSGPGRCRRKTRPTDLATLGTKSLPRYAC
jgi:hypothetical protein